MSSRPAKESSDSQRTMQSEEPPVRYNRLGKPLPTLPNIARNGHPKKGTPNNGNQRSPIEPSMISPPSLINPVTMEPHATHFDQAFFIPANDCPSPVPSPGPTPSPLTREWTVNSPGREKERPMTGASDAHCEQSVWESDSDSESVGPKSLSKKPIDTLRKVRSRVHLRTAKSAPRLKTAPPPPPPVPPHPDGPPLEKFPSMPEQPVQRPSPPPPPVPPKPANMKKPVSRTRSRREVFRPSAQGSLRIVAPSTTSLPRPDSRKNSQPDITARDIDRSTAAAALQAQNRRRQRPNSPHLAPAPSFSDKEKFRTLCREEPTEHTLHSSLALGRRPLYRRFWESLRILSCHGDVPAKPTRKSV